MMLQESGVIPRIMRMWRGRRNKDYGGKAEGFPLGYENLLFPVNLLARIHCGFAHLGTISPILTRD